MALTNEMTTELTKRIVKIIQEVNQLRCCKTFDVHSQLCLKFPAILREMGWFKK